MIPLIAEAKGDKVLRYFAPNVDTVTLALAIVIKPQWWCTVVCVVHCCVRRKSIFDQQRATSVKMCQEIFLDSTVLTHSVE